MSTDLRLIAQDLIRTALAAVEPGPALKRAVRREETSLSVGMHRFHLPDVGSHWNMRIRVVGAGKAASGMACALNELLDGDIDDGFVLARDEGGSTGWAFSQAGSIRIARSGHPRPDVRGADGGKEMIARVSGLDRDDLVIVLLSGGASSLMTLPWPGLTLEDVAVLNDLLLASGAPIEDINVVRKHVDVLKGGRLAALCSPAWVLSLVVSDVIDNPLSVIASGPTSPDPSRFEDALEILARYHLKSRVPPRILDHLQNGVSGNIPETIKPGDPVLSRVYNHILCDNWRAAQAVAVQADRLGFRSLVLTTSLRGEARHVGPVLASLLRQEVFHHGPVVPPSCLILGGETTVTLDRAGTGGRNQELALAAALELDGVPDILLVTLATDGSDGPTDAAGAFVDGSTVARARAMGLDARAALEAHDAYPFFDALGDLLRLGPTGTNVNDLAILLADAPSSV